MAYQEPRRQTSDVLLACEEVQYRSSQELAPRALTPTTITTAGVVSDTQVDTTFAGAYLVPEDGNMRDQVRQVKSLSAGATVTADAGWVSTTSVTSIRAWTPADVPVRVTTGGGTTTVTSSPHGSITNEPDDYWNLKGYYLLGLTGTNAGKASRVTDFATSGGVFTVATAFASTTASDVFLLRKRVRSEGAPAFELGRTSVARAEVGFADAATAVQTNRTGSVTFDMAIKGLATAGSSTAVRPIDICDFLSAVMTETLDTGTTATASSATVCAMGSASGLTVGGFCLLSSGEAAQIRSISSNDVTFGTAHFTQADITAGSTAYAACHYKRKTTDFRTFCFDYFMGGLYRKIAHGCMPTINIAIARDQVPKLNFAYTVAEGHEYTLSTPVAVNASMPIGLVDSVVPFDTKGSRCLFNGVKVLLDNLSINLGYSPVMRPSLSTANQADGCAMTLTSITGSFSILSDEDDRSSFEDIIDLMNRRAVVDFLYQHGTAAKYTWAAAIPAMQLTATPQTYQDGIGVYNVSFTALLPQSVQGNSFDAALPAFSMGWL